MPATEALFREDAYQRRTDATVLSVRDGAVVLDRTVFYYTAGGQPGDTGMLSWNGGTCRIAGTVLDGNDILHLVADDDTPPPPSTPVRGEIDWDRRHGLMKMHTTLHLLMAVVPCQINGCQIGEAKSRIDFDTQGLKLDKAEIQAGLDRLIAADLPVTADWTDAAALDRDPALVRTMATEPPRGDGRLRLVRIGPDTDTQPCGGTHIRSTAEIGPLRVGKIDNKGAHNKRVTVHLTD